MEKSRFDFGSLKSLLILDTMARGGEHGYMGVHEISEITGYNQSTVHRILNEMLQCGYVEKNVALRKYKIGMEALIMASRFIHTDTLVTMAREEMLKLNQETTETIHLVSLVGFEVVYLSKIDAHHSVGLLSSVGKLNPVYCTSGGKAMAAYQSGEWLENYLGQVKLEKMTPATLTTPEAFRRELQTIRSLGYAMDRQEHHANIVCVGAPIFDQTGKVAAAVSVAAPLYRFSVEKAQALAPRIREGARKISEQLGAHVK